MTSASGRPGWEGRDAGSGYFAMGGNVCPATPVATVRHTKIARIRSGSRILRPFNSFTRVAASEPQAKSHAAIVPSALGGCARTPRQYHPTTFRRVIRKHGMDCLPGRETHTQDSRVTSGKLRPHPI